MSKKTYFFNTQLTTLSLKKVLAINVYSKAFVRFSKKYPQNVIFFLDLSFDESSLSSSSKLGLLQGSNVYTVSKSFAHCHHKSLSFNFFISSSNVFNFKQYTQTLLKSLTSVFNPDSRVSHQILFLASKKGGFLGFLQNFIGFIPKSQLKLVYKTCLGIFTNSWIPSRFYLFLKKRGSFFLFRVPFKAGSLTMHPQYKQLNYSLTYSNLFPAYNKLNFVFLYRNLKKK
jgi:hypothetical protein